MKLRRSTGFVMTVLFAMCSVMLFGAAYTSNHQDHRFKTFFAGSNMDLSMSMSTDGVGIQPLGGVPIQSHAEQIHYASRQVSSYRIFPQMPSYGNHNCGVTGAGNKIAFYNLQFPQLLPGHFPGGMSGNIWHWMTQNQ